MSDSEDLIDALVDAAGKPKKVSTPAATVEAHSLAEIAQAAKQAGAQEQSRSSGLLRFDKLVPPGAV